VTAPDPSAGQQGPRAVQVPSPTRVEQRDTLTLVKPRTLTLNPETRTLTLVPSEPGDREPRESGPPPMTRANDIVVSCTDYPPVCDDSDRLHVVRSTANPFDKPSRPSAFQRYSRSPGMPNMETRSHYFSPVVGDPIRKSRFLTH